MHLHARVLKVWIEKNLTFHPTTGAPNRSSFLEARVIDLDTNNVYRCTFRDSSQTDRLRQAYKENQSQADYDALVTEIEATEKQRLENQDRTFIVIDIRTFNDEITLVVREP
jgi:hypothetical protein